MIDKSQDVELLGGYQNDTHTVLRFSRPLETCDEEDRKLTVGVWRPCGGGRAEGEGLRGKGWGEGVCDSC